MASSVVCAEGGTNADAGASAAVAAKVAGATDYQALALAAQVCCYSLMSARSDLTIRRHNTHFRSLRNSQSTWAKQLFRLLLTLPLLW